MYETEAEEPVQPATPPPLPVQAPPKPPGMNFRNPGAVRAGMLVAAAICLLQSVPMPSMLQPFWFIVLMLAGGFVAVYIYHRRTGAEVSLVGGARLGWMTGVFVFLVVLVLVTINFIGMGMQPFLDEMLEAARGRPEVTEQFEAVLKTPSGLAAMLFLVLIAMFFLLTLIASAGGALAAKVLEKD